jgi:hypothetical protein
VEKKNGVKRWAGCGELLEGQTHVTHCLGQAKARVLGLRLLYTNL